MSNQNSQDSNRAKNYTNAFINLDGGEVDANKIIFSKPRDAPQTSSDQNTDNYMNTFINKNAKVKVRKVIDMGSEESSTKLKQEASTLETDSTEDDCYPMGRSDDASYRGRCVVLNYQLYKDENMTRHGSEHDVNEIKALFKKLKFEVQVYNNFSKDVTLAMLEIGE